MSPHYNDRVDPETAAYLLALNRTFYAERGGDFSATRLRVQPGVRRIAQRLDAESTILDLGCGNGAFALVLARQGHRGRYVGIDQSAPMLDHARGKSYGFPVQFIEADITEIAQAGEALATPGGSTHERSVGPGVDWPILGDAVWSLITAFALLHHIPGVDLRLAILRRVRAWMRPDGQFVLSNWQFSRNSRLRSRIQQWSRISSRLDVDAGDHLLDWRRGGEALRYVHEFSEAELADLASEAGFVVAETFYSDGADGRSGLYQVWTRS